MIIIDPIDKPMRTIDAPGPAAFEIELQCFRFADARKRMLQNIFAEFLNPLMLARVLLFPKQIIFIGRRREFDFHPRV